RRRRRVGEVVVGAAVGDLAELLADRAGVLTLQETDRVHQPRLLLLQSLAVVLGVDARHVASSPAPLASASRLSISSGRPPASATILSRETNPETMWTSRSRSERVSASSLTTAAFALPSSA